MIITELQAETTYSVTVAAYTTKGDGARSKPKLITTTGAGNATLDFAFNEMPALLSCGSKGHLCKCKKHNLLDTFSCLLDSF